MKTKDILLRELLSSGTADGFVSGQRLAEICGISRTSVWKAVEMLRRGGAQIEAVTNRGYRLTDSACLFSADSIQALLPENSGIHVSFLKTVDSTNTEAGRRLAGSEFGELHRNVIVAAEQSAGRGRLGRSFYSPVQNGIYLSIIYSFGSITDPARVTATAAVAVCRALKSVYGVEAQIKWVNDVFIRGRKVCGILTEGISNFETGRIETAVIGIGVNIIWDSGVSGEIAETAGGIIDSSEKAGPAVMKRSALAASIISEVIRILDGGESEMKAAMSEYKKRSLLIGKTIEVSPVINRNDRNYFCIVEDITDDAKLVVKTDDGQLKILDSGEVSLHSSAAACKF